MTTPVRTMEQPLLPRYSDENPLLVYLSLGWGVQSWALAAMIALGYLPPIDIALTPTRVTRPGAPMTMPGSGLPGWRNEESR